MNIEEITDIVREMDSELEAEDDGFAAAVVLLTAALETGPHIGRVCEFTGYAHKVVAQMSHHLRKSGVWKYNKTHCQWSDEENGGVAFWCDVNVALGLLSRTRGTKRA